MIEGGIPQEYIEQGIASGKLHPLVDLLRSLATAGVSLVELAHRTKLSIPLIRGITGHCRPSYSAVFLGPRRAQR